MPAKHNVTQDRYNQYIKNVLTGFPTDDINSLFYVLFSDDINQINKKRNLNEDKAKIKTSAVASADKKINILIFSNLKYNEAETIAGQIQQASQALMHKNSDLQSTFSIKPNIHGSSLDNGMYDLGIAVPQGIVVPGDFCRALIGIKKPQMHYRNLLRKITLISACMLLPFFGVIAPIMLLLTPFFFGVTIAPIVVTIAIMTLSAFATILAISNTSQLTKTLSSEHYKKGLKAVELAQEIKNETQKQFVDDIDLITTKNVLAANELERHPTKIHKESNQISTKTTKPEPDKQKPENIDPCPQLEAIVKKHKNCIIKALSTKQLKDNVEPYCNDLFTHFNEIRIRNLIQTALQLTDDLILKEVQNCYKDFLCPFTKSTIWQKPHDLKNEDLTDFALHVIRKAISHMDKQTLLEKMSGANIIKSPEKTETLCAFQALMSSIAEISLHKKQPSYESKQALQDAAKLKLLENLHTPFRVTVKPGMRLQQTASEPVLHQNKAFIETASSSSVNI